MVKAFKSSLIWRQKYSVYWFIHSIREIPLPGIKSLCEQLDLNKTLTRAWSIGGLLGACAANDRNSQWSGSPIMISNVKRTSRLWNSEQSRAASRASSEQMRLASLLLVYHFTDYSDTSSCCSGVMLQSTTIWPDHTSWWQSITHMLIWNDWFLFNLKWVDVEWTLLLWKGQHYPKVHFQYTEPCPFSSWPISLRSTHD